MQMEPMNFPGIGLRETSVRSSVWNRVGASVILGQVVMTDTKATQGESSKTQTNPGADDFPLNNVITPTTAGIGVLSGDPGYWFGVVTDLGTVGTGADNTKVGVTWAGYVNVLITTGTTSEYGKTLYPANAATGVTTTAVAAVKSVGRVLVDTTTSATVSLALWNGIFGMGSEAAS
jgi:hypothetical protein